MIRRRREHVGFQVASEAADSECLKCPAASESDWGAPHEERASATLNVMSSWIHLGVWWSRNRLVYELMQQAQSCMCHQNAVPAFLCRGGLNAYAVDVLICFCDRVCWCSV